MANWRLSRIRLAEVNSYALESGIFSDIEFRVGLGEDVEVVKSHTLILRLRSAAFATMIDTELERRTDPAQPICVDITNSTPKAFRTFLKFLYTDEFSVKIDNVLEVLVLAYTFEIPYLVAKCACFAKTIIDINTAVPMYTLAKECGQDDLQKSALDFMLTNAAALFLREEFLMFDFETVCMFLKQDRLKAPELLAFNAALRWGEAECRRRKIPSSLNNRQKILEKILCCIRFPLMTLDEFSENVAPTRILPQEDIINLFRYLTISSDLKHSVPGIPYSARPRIAEYIAFCYKSCQCRDPEGFYTNSEQKHLFFEILKFKTNVEVTVIGFGFYGPVVDKKNNRPDSDSIDSVEYEIRISVAEESHGQLNEMIFEKQTKEDEDFVMMLESPFQMRKNCSYIANVEMKGTRTRFGMDYIQQSDVILCGGKIITFSFIKPKEFNHSGIVRGIVFTL